MSLLNQYLKTIGQAEAGYGSAPQLPYPVRGQKRKDLAGLLPLTRVVLLLAPALLVGAVASYHFYDRRFGLLGIELKEQGNTSGAATPVIADNFSPSSAAISAHSVPAAGTETATGSEKTKDQMIILPKEVYSTDSRGPETVSHHTADTSIAAPQEAGGSSLQVAQSAPLHAEEGKRAQTPAPAAAPNDHPSLTAEEEADNLYKMGLMAFQDERLADAESFLLESLKLNPGDSDALLNLSNLYIRQDRFDLAERTLQQIQSMDQRNTKSLDNLGVVALRREERETARMFFNRALHIDPSDVTALINLAYLAQTENNAAEAQAYYEKIIALNPEHVDAFIRLAYLKEQEGKVDHAIQLYHRCLRLQSVQYDSLLARKIRNRINLMRVYE